MALTSGDLNVYKIARYIGHCTSDLGKLCSSVKNNKFSKNKPVRSDVDGALTDAQKKAINYGLEIKKYTSISSLISDVGNGIIWQYLKPRGESQNPKEWYRIKDFLGYEHHAECFAKQLNVPSQYVKGTAGSEGVPITVQLTPDNQLVPGSIKLSDLDHINDDELDFGDFYFAVLFVTGSTYYLVSSSSAISSNTQTASATLPSSLLDGIYASGTGTACTIYPLALYSSCSSGVSGMQNINTQITTGAYLMPLSPKQMTIVTNLANMSIYEVSVTIGSGRFTVAFDAKALSTQQDYFISGIQYTIYGGATEGATTTSLATGYITESGYSQGTVLATSTVKTFSVSETIMSSTPAYVTVVLSYVVSGDTRTDTKSVEVVINQE